MRGKAKMSVFENIAYGITPAYAGKRPVAAFTCGFIQDHPRLCGEKNLTHTRF